MPSYHLIKTEDEEDLLPTGIEEIDHEEKQRKRHAHDERECVSSKTLKIAAVLIVASWAMTILYYARDFYNIPGSPQELSSPEWIQTAMDHPIDKTIGLTPISDLCGRTSWKDGLVFNCTGIRGEFGNVRNDILTCLRYSIEAGASGFILPQIELASSSTIPETFQQRAPLDYLFSKSHFVTSLGTACPKMRIYESLERFESLHSPYTSMELRGNTISAYLVRSLTLARPSEWRGAFETWLGEKFDHKPSADTPIMVSIRNPMFEWPMSYETPNFINAFGQLLRIQDDVRELAATVLYELTQVLARNNTIIHPTSGITRNLFYGALLRTDSEATHSDRLGYDAQARHYLSHAASNGLTAIYVSGGSQEEVERMTITAQADFGMDVTTKEQLLQGADLGKLQSMTLDQRGLVDYEVMLKSSLLGGIDMSSSAVNIAMRRHGLLEDTWDAMGPRKLNLKMEEGEQVGHSNFTISDGLSDIIHDPKNPHFMVLGMWP